MRIKKIMDISVYMALTIYTAMTFLSLTITCARAGESISKAYQVLAMLNSTIYGILGLVFFTTGVLMTCMLRKYFKQFFEEFKVDHMFMSTYRILSSSSVMLLAN